MPSAPEDELHSHIGCVGVERDPGPAEGCSGVRVVSCLSAASSPGQEPEG